MYKTAPAIPETSRQEIRRWLEIEEDKPDLYVLPAMVFDLRLDQVQQDMPAGDYIRIWRRRCTAAGGKTWFWEAVRWDTNERVCVSWDRPVG